MGWRERSIGATVKPSFAGVVVDQVISPDIFSAASFREGDRVIGLLLSFAIGTVAATLGFGWAREFVRRKLRYVDAAQNPIAPVVAGAGAWLIAIPVVALLPIVGPGTAIAF